MAWNGCTKRRPRPICRLLRALRNLERDGIPANFNLNLSPVLLEQLTHPHFIAEFPQYLERKITAAREDEAFFLQMGDHQLAETARSWARFYAAALEDFRAFGGDIISGFRRFADVGMIEILTCAATHGYLPLLGTDESLRAQVRLAVDTHTRHLGRRPRGIWLPECGYRPAGRWEYPVDGAGDGRATGFERIGIEQALAESGLEYFFVDSLPGPARSTSFARPLLTGRRKPCAADAASGTRDARAGAQPLSAVLRRWPVRQALCGNSVPARSLHRDAGVVGRCGLSGRPQLSRLPQEALSRRAPLLACDRARRRHGREADLLAGTCRRARGGARGAFRRHGPRRTGGQHEPRDSAGSQRAVRRGALRPLVVRGPPCGWRRSASKLHECDSIATITCSQYLDQLSPRRLVLPCRRVPGAPRAATRYG